MCKIYFYTNVLKVTGFNASNATNGSTKFAMMIICTERNVKLVITRIYAVIIFGKLIMKEFNLFYFSVVIVNSHLIL